MTQKCYTTKDFSPVHGPETKPARPGWYVAKPARGTLTGSGIGHLWRAPHVHLPVAPSRGSLSMEFWYYDGESWRASDGGLISQTQDRYWFGLKSNPLAKMRTA